MALVLEIIIPIFGFIALGYLLARTPLLTAEGARGLSQFCLLYTSELPTIVRG